MLSYLVKSIVRNLAKYRFYTMINVAGLLVGITSFTLLFFYSQYELSYDKFQKDYQDIFRLTSDIKTAGTDLAVATSPAVLGQVLQLNFPEVKSYCRVYSNGGKVVRIGNNILNEEFLFYVDSNFFKFFNYDFLYGNHNTALNSPRSVVITEEVAEKFFGTTDVLTKTINIEHSSYQVSGVLKSIPKNSHFIFNCLIPRSALGSPNLSWSNIDHYTYVKVPGKSNQTHFKERLAHIYKEFSNEKDLDVKFNMQPLDEIHFTSNLLAEFRVNGDLKYVNTCLAIAFALLAISWINYMNISSVLYLTRTKEIAIKKIVGATKKILLFQFIGESVFCAIVAFIGSIALVFCLLSFFNELTGVDISYTFFLSVKKYLIAFLIILMLAILSGWLPVLVLMNTDLVNGLRNKLSSGFTFNRLRNYFMLFQFIVSITFINCTIIVYNQLKYITNKNIGFDKDMIGVIQINSNSVSVDPLVLKKQLSAITAIEKVSLVSSSPGLDMENYGGFKLYQEGQLKQFLIMNYSVDHDYLDLLKIKIVEGRNFNNAIVSDKSSSVLVNEAFVNKYHYNWKFKEKILKDDVPYNVIGIVSSFHLRSLHEDIEPLIITYRSDSLYNVLVKFRQSNITQTIADIKREYQKLYPESPFEMTFLTNKLSGLYSHDKRKGMVFVTFAVLSIFIALLGLLGLASFNAYKKSKEIGVRKVFGASSLSVFIILSKSLLISTAIATLLGYPIALYFTNNWMESFAYRDFPSIYVFLISGVFILLVSLLTTGFHSLKASLLNPITSLREN